MSLGTVPETLSGDALLREILETLRRIERSLQSDAQSASEAAGNVAALRRKAFRNAL